MPRDNHGFNNEIKDYELIRGFIRQLFHYGDLSTKELSESKLYGNNTTVSYHLKQIQNYLKDDRLRTFKTKESGKPIKTQSIIYDPLSYPINNLTQTFQESTFSVNDIIFYFTIMQLFSNSDFEELNEIEDYFDEDDSLYYSKVKGVFDNLIHRQNAPTILKQFKSEIVESIGIKKSALSGMYQLKKKSDNPNEIPFSDSTFRRYFDKLTKELGIFISAESTVPIYQKNSKNNFSITDRLKKDADGLSYYKLSNNIFAPFTNDLDTLNKILDMICFFYNQSDIPVPGWQLANTLRTYIYSYYPANDIDFPEDPIYLFPDNNVLNVLDSDIFWNSITAIHNHNAIQFMYHTNESDLCITAYPIKVISERQYGRQYLFAYDYEAHEFYIYRLDRMSKVQEHKKIQDDLKYSFVNPESQNNIDQALQRTYENIFENAFNVDIKNYENPQVVLLHFKVKNESLEKLKKRISGRTKKGEFLNESDTGFDYRIKVTNEIEIIPWIREFGSLVTVDKEANPELNSKIKNELTEILRRYESI